MTSSCFGVAPTTEATDAARLARLVERTRPVTAAVLECLDMSVSSHVMMIDACRPGDSVAAPAEVPPRHAAPADVEQAAQMFGLLADPGRLRLLLALLPGEMCVCDLAAVSGQSPSSVSHALRLLRAARVVRVRRVARRAFYRLDDEHVRAVLGLALAHQGHAVPPLTAGAVHG